MAYNIPEYGQDIVRLDPREQQGGGLEQVQKRTARALPVHVASDGAGAPRQRMPSTYGATGGVPTTPYSATSNLRGQQINPVASAPTQGAMGYATRGLSDLFDTPNRQDLALSTFQRIRESTEPEFQKELRGVGQKAAALGRLGAGMTTSELGDVTSNRERFLGQTAGQLSDEAAGRELEDRLGRFGAATGATSLFEGIDRGRRDELRGERGFQNEMQQQALNDYIRQQTLQEMLLQGEFGRNLDWTQFLTGTGYGG